MSKNRTVRSISFKLDSPYEVQLLEHATKQANFSSYVKRLIQRDMEGGSNPHHIKITKQEDNSDNFF